MKRYLLIILMLLGAGSLSAQSHVSDLVVTPAFGDGTIKWYNASTGGTQYTSPGTTNLVDGTTYYASQTVNGIEGAVRFAVTAHLDPTPSFTIQPGAAACLNTDVVYSAPTGMPGYLWTYSGVVSEDYTITSGGEGTHSVTLKWKTTGDKTVSIKYCTEASLTPSTPTTVSNCASMAIGDSYAGGKVACIFVSDDPGYVDGETHGLIASAADLGTSVAWWNGTNTTTGATATALGSGSANTTAIISSQGNTGSYAAKICRDYTGSGYTDWYLPSKDELEKLYINKSTIGGFSVNYYWSSSESSTNEATCMHFDGNYFSRTKDIQYRVRAIRSF